MCYFCPYFLLVQTQKISSGSCKSKLNLDYNYPFPIDLVPNGIKFGVKSI